MTESQQLLSRLGRSNWEPQKPLHKDPGLEVRAGDPIQGSPLRPLSPQRNSLGCKHLPSPYSQDQSLTAILTRKLGETKNGGDSHSLEGTPARGWDWLQ